MRILNVNHILDPVHGGGTAERTVQISRHLARRGYACHVLTTEAGLPGSRRAGLAGVDLTIVPLLSKRFFMPRMSSWAVLRRLVREADVVHIMGHWALLSAVVWLTVRSLRKPYVVCPAGSLPIYGRSRLFKRLYNLVVGKKMVSHANACIAITEDEVGQFAQYGVDCSRVVVIPNGISPEDFVAADPVEFRDKHGLGAAPFVLFMGRLNHIKGPDLLLRAFASMRERFPEVHLVFAGPDGGMLNDLRQLADIHALAARVHFIGHVSGTEKNSAYRAASLLVIPSRQEAMSIVVLEAGIMGTPVLLTDQCGFNAVDGCGGKVVSATVDALAIGLVELLGKSSQLRAMGDALNTFVRERHLWDVIIGRYIALYERLVK